jgi:hypothetical protein
MADRLFQTDVTVTLWQSIKCSMLHVALCPEVLWSVVLWSLMLRVALCNFATGHAHFQFSAFQRFSIYCPPLVPFVNPCARCASAKVSIRPWTLFPFAARIRFSAFSILPSPFYLLLGRPQSVPVRIVGRIQNILKVLAPAPSCTWDGWDGLKPYIPRGPVVRGPVVSCVTVTLWSCGPVVPWSCGPFVACCVLHFAPRPSPRHASGTLGRVKNVGKSAFGTLVRLVSTLAFIVP